MAKQDELNDTDLCDGTEEAYDQQAVESIPFDAEQFEVEDD